MGACSTKDNAAHAGAGGGSVPQKAPNADAFKSTLNSGVNQTSAAVNQARSTATNAVNTGTGAATQASQYVDQARNQTSTATKTIQDAGKQTDAAAVHVAQFASANAPAPVAGHVTSAVNAVSGATSGLSSAAQRVDTVTASKAAQLNDAHTQVQARATEASNTLNNNVNTANAQAAGATQTANTAAQTAEAKARETAGSGAGGLRQLANSANQAAGAAPGPFATVASTLAATAAGGAADLSRVSEAPHTQSTFSTPALPTTATNFGSVSAANPIAQTSNITTGVPNFFSHPVTEPHSAVPPTFTSFGAPTTSSQTSSSTNTALPSAGRALELSHQEPQQVNPALAATVGSGSQTTSARSPAGNSSSSDVPNTPVFIHLGNEEPVAQTAGENATVSSPRPNSPIVVRDTDSAAKQRLDRATLNVRKLKKERAALDQVKQAVDEYKAARDALARETGIVIDPSPTAAQTNGAEALTAATAGVNNQTRQKGANTGGS